MIQRDPKDPGQPRLPPIHGAAENPNLIEDYVRTFSLHHGSDFVHAQRMRGIMREFLVLGFLAETGLMPTETVLVERHDDNRTYWSYHPATPRDNFAANEQKAMRARIDQLEHELAAAREQIIYLKGRR